MRRSLLVLLIVLVAGVGAFWFWQSRDEGGAIPDAATLRRAGFAVWPHDTLEEAETSCGEAEEWQKEPGSTAARFASEVLRYPEPALGDPLTFDDDPKDEIRYLVNSKGVRGVFLGSVIDVRKFGACWYVVHLEPREGGFLPSIAFAHDGTDVQMVFDPQGYRTSIGLGSWETEVSDEDDQVVVDLPPLPPDTTGHVMSLGTTKNVLDGSAARMGAIPSPVTTPTRPMPLSDVVRNDRICRRGDAYRHTGAALADLYTFTFGSAVSTHGRKVDYPRGEGAERLGKERWRLTVDDAVVETTIRKIRKGCWRILAFDDGGEPLLETLNVERDHLTFELNWREATSGSITLSTSRGGSRWSFETIERPLTVRNYEAWNLDEPIEVTVVLRDGRRVITAERTWHIPG